MNNEVGKIKIEENMTLNKAKKDTNNTIQNKDENKVKGKIREIARGNKKLNKNFNPKKGSQTFIETLDFKIHERKLSNPPENQINSKILGEENFQISPKKLNNPKISEDGFRTSLINSIPVDCEKESNQISLRNVTQFYLKESKGKDFLILPEEINFSRGTSMDNNC